MKIAMHTMATPGRSLDAAIDLAVELGFDGIEIIVADDYDCALPTMARGEALIEVRMRAADRGLTIVGLVPYARDFNTLDAAKRTAAIEAMQRTMDQASRLGARNVRVFAGAEPNPADEAQQFGLLVASLSELAKAALERNLVLNVENHVGTAAISAERTRAIVDAVASPALGILYDPANLLRLGEGDHEAGFAQQTQHVRHVHFKDTIVEGAGRYHPTLAGEGQVPWRAIIDMLRRAGYGGFISAEYEKRWHPERLPEPAEGLAHELAFLRVAIAGA